MNRFWPEVIVVIKHFVQCLNESKVWHLFLFASAETLNQKGPILTKTKGVGPSSRMSSYFKFTYTCKAKREFFQFKRQ